jgi:hypothetical protein
MDSRGLEPNVNVLDSESTDRTLLSSANRKQLPQQSCFTVVAARDVDDARLDHRDVQTCRNLMRSTKSD